jgi:hypothetical protein
MVAIRWSAIAGLKRQRGFGPLPRRRPPSASPLVRTHAALTPCRRAMSSAVAPKPPGAGPAADERDDGGADSPSRSMSCAINSRSSGCRRHTQRGGPLRSCSCARNLRSWAGRGRPGWWRVSLTSRRLGYSGDWRSRWRATAIRAGRSRRRSVLRPYLHASGRLRPRPKPRVPVRSLACSEPCVRGGRRSDRGRRSSAHRCVGAARSGSRSVGRHSLPCCAERLKERPHVCDGRCAVG